MEENLTIQTGDLDSQGSQEQDLMSAFEVTQDQEQTVQDQGDQTLDTNSGDIDNFEIDERFSNLPKAEALIRTLQSRHDKVYSELQNTLRELEQYRQYKNTFDQLLEDDEVFEAFVYSRKPELVKEKDVTEIIKNKLKEEFGDYKPTREEAEEDPGGKAWLYYKRLDELYDEYKNKKSAPKSIEEIIKRKAEEKKKQEEALLQEIEKVKKSMNWDDNQLVSFRNWANKLTIHDLAKMYNFALRTMRMNVKSASSLPSSDTSLKGARQSFIEELKRNKL